MRMMTPEWIRFVGFLAFVYVMVFITLSMRAGEWTIDDDTI